jgi:6-phosphogluconolactonase
MLAPNDPPFAKVDPGAGPRHFVFHPNNKFVYVIDELASTVTAFSYDAATGSLQRLTVVSTLPPDYKGKNDTAEIKIDAEGKFLYGSNRGADMIAIFALDSASGAPKWMDSVPAGGKTPRNFEIDPSGGYLLAANQATNNIVIFKIDPQTGHLTPTGQTLSVAAPVCIKFVMIK